MEGRRRNACDPPNTKENVPTKGKLIHSSWGSHFHPFRAPQHHNSAVVFPCSSFPFPQQLEYPRLSSCCWRLFPSLVTPLAQWVLQALVHPVVHVTCSNVTDSFQTSAGFPVSWTVDSQCCQGEKLKCSFLNLHPKLFCLKHTHNHTHYIYVCLYVYTQNGPKQFCENSPVNPMMPWCG